MSMGLWSIVKKCGEIRLPLLSLSRVCGAAWLNKSRTEPRFFVIELRPHRQLLPVTRSAQDSAIESEVGCLTMVQIAPSAIYQGTSGVAYACSWRGAVPTGSIVV